MIGSIFYFTTGLHGFHVLFGSFGFFLTLWLILFVIHGILSSINASIYYSGCIDLISLSSLPMAIDFLCSLFLSSSYFRGFVFVLMKWNWIAVLGTYSIFAFSFSFSSSLYSWQSCCYVPFYLFDINRFLLSIEGVNFYFPSFLIEFSMSFFLVSYYWHFVDWIWFLVFLFFLLILILINFLIL